MAKLHQLLKLLESIKLLKLSWPLDQGIVENITTVDLCQHLLIRWSTQLIVETAMSLWKALGPLDHIAVIIYEPL